LGTINDPFIDWAYELDSGGIITPLSAYDQTDLLEQNVGDMFNFEVSAYVLGTIISEKYIEQPSMVINIFINIICSSLLFILIYLFRNKKFYTYLFITVLATFFSQILLMYIMAIVFEQYNTFIELHFVPWIIIIESILYYVVKHSKTAYNIA